VPRPLTSGSGRAWSCCCTRIPWSLTSRPAFGSNSTPTPSASGASAGPTGSSPWRINPVVGVRPLFPPLDRAVVAALACERVARTQVPLSRQSLGDLAGAARGELGKPISRTTVKRILDEDTIKPWQHEHWIFPRATDFFAKAAVVLDLYEGY